MNSQHVVDGSIGVGDLSAVAQEQLRQVGGYRAVHQSVQTPSGNSGQANASCPGDTRIIGTASWWTSSIEAPQVQILETDGYSKSATVYGHNDNGFPDTLHIALFCGRVSAS